LRSFIKYFIDIKTSYHSVAAPAALNSNSQFLISVPSRFVAVAYMWVDPNNKVTLTVLSSTD